jgi:hypothetical protein
MGHFPWAVRGISSVVTVMGPVVVNRPGSLTVNTSARVVRLLMFLSEINGRQTQPTGFSFSARHLHHERCMRLL